MNPERTELRCAECGRTFNLSKLVSVPDGTKKAVWKCLRCAWDRVDNAPGGNLNTYFGIETRHNPEARYE